jgi:formylmethanofuran dehydrogenase subunit E
MELSFLRNMNLPLPRRCPFCRINEKFNQWVKNLRVIPRICDKCGASFTTDYTKEEAPYILCKACYLKEVV